MWIIRHRTELAQESGEPLYWSNTDGWTLQAQADTFSNEEQGYLRLPIDGVWVLQPAGPPAGGHAMTKRQDSQSSSGGFGLLTVLFIVFLVLKLTGHIAWSWWWVTCPLWAGWGLILIVFLVVLVFRALDSPRPWIQRKQPWE